MELGKLMTVFCSCCKLTNFTIGKTNCGVANLVDRYLGHLYPEYLEHTRPVLIRQPRDLLVCTFHGDLQKFEEEFLSPAANIIVYYLEPASPLKSITNTAQLAPTQKQQLNNGTLITNGSVTKSREENGSNLWTNGLPMSLSSTSNSLKSSGTFNSNSSINSTPSVDRYAALKALDEQLREIKEKDNHQTNTLSSNATTAPVNPFNVIQSQSTVSAMQPNPFQATSSPHWFNEQQPNSGTTTHHNGNGHTGNGLTGAQPIYPMTNGTTNGIYDQSTFGLNGNVFNGYYYYYSKVTDTNMFNGSFNMTNGFPQKNPFAAPVLNATTNPFL